MQSDLERGDEAFEPLSEVREDSGVNPRIDPFAPRPGHELCFKNIHVALTRKKEGDLDILQDISGTVHPKQLYCILGHSGSGKTTLLHTLAGKLSNSRLLNVDRGTLTIDGVPFDPTSTDVKRKIAFVEQNDLLLATATPREAIRFSARLRLPRDMENEEIEVLVTRILTELRLLHRADAMIGGPHFRGLSGGEMRRVSLGAELVVRPSILFLDEVTSGLDSHNAFLVMDACKHVASSGAAVAMTIHQPSSKVFGLIDRLLLLKDGRALYEGDASHLTSYFADRGHPVPPFFNPADWMLQISQTMSSTELEKDGFYSDFPPIYSVDAENHESLNQRRSTFFKSMRLLNPSVLSLTSKRLSIFETLTYNERVPWATELKCQLTRDMRNLKRDSHAMLLRIGIVLVGSVLIAICFAGIGRESLESVSSFQSHVGAVFLLSMVNTIATQVILLDFIDQRPRFVHEFGTDHFRIASYGIARLCVEASSTLLQVFILILLTYWSLDLNGRFGVWLAVLFTFAMVMTALGVLLASATKDARNAKELIPMTVLPQLLLCGFFVQIESLPGWIRWAQWIMPLTYTFRLLLNEEFKECLNFSEQETNAVNCARSLQNAFQTADYPSTNDNMPMLYNDTSVMNVPRIGKYTGPQGILEYLDLTTQGAESTAVFVNACNIGKGNAISVNKISESLCDTTVTSFTRIRLQPFLAKSGYSDGWVQFVVAQRYLYSYTKDLDSVIITEHNVLFPPGAIRAAFEGLDQNKVVSHVCGILNDHCSEVMSFNGFRDVTECIDHMQTLPHVSQDSHNQTVWDGNTTMCRLLHSQLVLKNPDLHCPHISYFPKEDTDGNTKCSESYNFTDDQYFTEADLTLVSQVSTHFGLAPEANGTFYVSDSESQKCSNNAAITEESLLGLDVFPDDIFCAFYLDRQNATGNNNGVYWLALVVFFVCFRILGLVLLRQKVVS